MVEIELHNKKELTSKDFYSMDFSCYYDFGCGNGVGKHNMYYMQNTE